MKILAKSLAILLFIVSGYAFVGIVYWGFVDPRLVAEPVVSFLIFVLPAVILWKKGKT